MKEEEQKCRVVLVPTFAETGVLVLVGLRRLDAKIVRFVVDEADVETNGAGANV